MSVKRETVLLTAAVLALTISTAMAQEGSHQHPMDMAVEEMAPAMDETVGQEMDHSMHQGMGHEMNHDPVEPQPSSAAPRDPAAWSDSSDTKLSLHLGDQHRMGAVIFDRLEAVQQHNNRSVAYEMKAWYGYDYDRLLIKAEGGVDNGSIEEAKTELFWSHAIAAFWNSNIGLRHDSGHGTDQTWLAAGVAGLAPYWFEVGATAYLTTEGRSAAKLSADYDLLFTQRLILQPRFETNLYGKRDDEKMHGTGVTDVVVGLRLRYEIKRELAPYIGIEWSGKFGNTAAMARSAGAETTLQRVVAGVRFWF